MVSDTCIINSKINGTLKGVYLLISKLHSILAVANLLAFTKIERDAKTQEFFFTWKFKIETKIVS